MGPSWGGGWLIKINKRNNGDVIRRFITANPEQLHFWLRKAAIIRPYVSENVKRKLYIFWLLYAAETCSFFGFTIIKVV